MTLALLITAVTGAWATETLLTTINASSDFISGSKTFDGVATVTFTGNIAYDDMPNYGWSAGYGTPGGSVSVEPAEGITISSCKFYFDTNETYTISTAPFVLYLTTEDSSFRIYTGPNSTGEMLYGNGIKKIEVYGTAETPITVEPGSSANTWTFSMPGSDVVLTPLYAPAAKWDVVENVEQLPAALEGIIAGQDAAIVTAGQSAQGTVMYAVTTSAEAAPALTAFNATVPTAKDYDDATTLYVWYYIQGADAPEGQEATEENTFSDTEPACLTVQVLTNKFDIQFNAANANTIEAGRATVTVAGAAATVTDGKLQGVKMGSEVKMTAKQGYKFRKVEVKKNLVNTVDLSTLTAAYEAQDGDELTGTLGANVKITIADGATVTLKDLTINGASGSSYPWAGLTPLGDATIVLEGTNTVNGFHDEYPGIFAAVGKTLTIKGDGSLTASSNKGTGIGGGRSKPCGNIVIEGGNITATGGKTSPSGSYSSAGIGGGYNTSCGDITITGGTITAKGGNYSAGIGSGGASKASCGNITITNTVTKVTATKGSGAANSIGKGYGSCGTVTIGGVVGAISASPYTYQPGN